MARRSYTLIAFILLGSCMQLFAAKTGIDSPDVSKSISELDRALDRREAFMALRQEKIDSLKSDYTHIHSANTLIEIGEEYSSFSNDSAIVYFEHAIATAKNDNERISAVIRRASLLPLAGFFEAAIREFEAIDTNSISSEILPIYHEGGRKLYTYIASAFSDYKPYYELNRSKALDHQRWLLDNIDKNSDEYVFNLGEYYFLTGETSKAEALLGDLVTRTADKGLLARASHHLSTIAKQKGDIASYKYFLANSAIADIESATLEVISLQELGSALYADGDVERAYRYLSAALDNAVRCAASLRMVESSRALPLIASTHNNQLNSWRKSIYTIMLVMLILLIVLAATLFTLYRKMKRMGELEARLRLVNNSKDIYISQFLKLCSIYMDKLNQFCKLTERKISAGKADELYRMTKSGKFIEEQSSDFYDVFDNAFLHLYPDFVEKVNELLRQDSQIELKDGEILNTDLRILAITRMGIDDSASIAQILNYSLNTIYSYRNRLKSRAIDRDNFENNIMKIQTAT